MGLYQEDAATRMNVSRQTFGRIVESARRKVADALVNGKALKIEGGAIAMTTAMRTFRCSECGHVWEIAHGTGRPEGCPSCKSTNIHRDAQERGFGPRCRGGRGRGWGRPVP
jgi:rubrerythrin